MTSKNPNTTSKPKPSSKSAEFELVLLNPYSISRRRYVVHDRIADQVATFDSYSHAAEWIGSQHVSRFFSEISNFKSPIHPA
jgi:hypothetical protein